MINEQQIKDANRAIGHKKFDVDALSKASHNASPSVVAAPKKSFFAGLFSRPEGYQDPGAAFKNSTAAGSVGHMGADLRPAPKAPGEGLFSKLFSRPKESIDPGAAFQKAATGQTHITTQGGHLNSGIEAPKKYPKVIRKLPKRIGNGLINMGSSFKSTMGSGLKAGAWIAGGVAALGALSYFTSGSRQERGEFAPDLAMDEPLPPVVDFSQPMMPPAEPTVTQPAEPAQAVGKFSSAYLAEKNAPNAVSLA